MLHTHDMKSGVLMSLGTEADAGRYGLFLLLLLAGLHEMQTRGYLILG